MSADKRSTHTDALATLGTIIESGERDAIHLAVEPVIAAENLYPGQHIGIIEGKATTKADKKLGIVDPFISGYVPEGQKFWLIVYPRQITSLRHVWSHPDFGDQQPTKALETNPSEEWIRNLAERVGLSYKRVMNGADEWIATHDGQWGGEYICGGAEMEGEVVPVEFWDHYEKIKGITVDPAKKGNFFTCSC